MDFSSGVFAIFINDLQYSDSKISDYKFYYDGDSNDFVVKSKPELRYPRSAVAQNPEFMIFREVPVPAYFEGEELYEEEPSNGYEVEPYVMSEF